MMQRTMSNTPPQDYTEGRARRLKALIVKESLQIIRDPSSLLISVFLPLLLLFLYGVGVSLDMNHLRIGLVLQDTAPDAQSFAKALTDSTYLDVTMAMDRRELDRKLAEGSIRGFVVVPSYFSSFRKRPDNIAPIQVIGDGSEPNTAQFVQNYVQAAWQIWLQQESISSGLQGLPLVVAQPRFWYNEELESRFFLIPGSLAIIMTLIGTLLTALVVSREWERGTMEALLSTPVGVTEILIGKLVPYYVLAMGSMAMCVILSVTIYGLPLRGSWYALTIVTGTFLVPALGLGLLVSTLARSQVVAAQAAMVLGFLPAFILSGFIFEIASMPLPIRMITYIIPARYFVSSLQTIFLVGDDWYLIGRNLVPMLIVGLILFGLIARNTVKRLD